LGRVRAAYGRNNGQEREGTEKRKSYVFILSLIFGKSKLFYVGLMLGRAKTLEKCAIFALSLNLHTLQRFQLAQTEGNLIKRVDTILFAIDLQILTE
jgi:hypothetical protein